MSHNPSCLNYFKFICFPWALDNSKLFSIKDCHDWDIDKAKTRQIYYSILHSQPILIFQWLNRPKLNDLVSFFKYRFFILSIKIKKRFLLQFFWFNFHSAVDLTFNFYGIYIPDISFLRSFMMYKSKDRQKRTKLYQISRCGDTKRNRKERKLFYLIFICPSFYSN